MRVLTAQLCTPFPPSDVWVGWVLHVDFSGEIVASDVFDLPSQLSNRVRRVN